MPQKPIQCVFYDELISNRIRKVTKSRRYPRDSRTVRELALERLRQIEDFGDVPMMPARMEPAGTAPG